MSRIVDAVDIVANLFTEEARALRPRAMQGFYVEKIGIGGTYDGVSLPLMLARMDAAGIARAFLIAAKCGRAGLPASFRVPEAMVIEAIAAHPDRFAGLVGIDPTEGMEGVRALERAVRDHGFIGAHYYPHWFEIAPDDRRMYPFYAKCIELGVPIQMQVGQSLIYNPAQPLRSVGRPITLDTVACDLPELKLIGIHIGIPWTEEMIAMAWKHANVFIGTDAHSPKYWPPSFVHYLNSYGQDKVMFGTDFPILDFERTRREIDALGLKPDVLRKLLRDNARRIYGLSS